MESNWRWNVWRYGQAYGAFDLIARTVQNPAVWMGTLNGDRSGWNELRLNPLNSEMLIPSGVYHLVPPGSHFPFGVPVEPDVPV